jgi:hypothetical protein
MAITQYQFAQLEELIINMASQKLIPLMFPHDAHVLEAKHNFLST